MSLASLHSLAVVHTDVSPSQFVRVNHTYKLNDFNSVEFLAQSRTNKSDCRFSTTMRVGKFRSPEEYSEHLQDEKVSQKKYLTSNFTACKQSHKTLFVLAKIDIYSFGNILYFLVEGQWPYSLLELKEAQKLIMQGVPPNISESIRNSKDPVDSVLMAAMRMCYAYKPLDRPTAKQIETYLKQRLQELDPGGLEAWGDPS